MHDRDELCLELGLDITGDVFDGGGNGIMCSECGVDNDS